MWSFGLDMAAAFMNLLQHAYLHKIKPTKSVNDPADSNNSREKRKRTGKKRSMRVEFGWI